MQSQSPANLSAYHTFGIEQTCQHLVTVHSVQDIIQAYQQPQWQALPKLMLGKGSNMLFTEPYQGVVMVNQLLGKSVTESEHAWHLHIAAGEDWPALVEWSLAEHMPGLENLALIPGCAGSAPIQNIGAYGVEFKDVCEYVDILHLDSLTTQRLSNQECQFGYRDSIFKHDLYQRAIVVAVGLRLSKSWQPKAEYGPLKALAEDAITAQAIYDIVCQTRIDKLPNPNEQGNAGSFFKNPVISLAHYQQLKAAFPELVAYPAQDGMKVAAGWLIDQCGLKGVSVGGAQVHPKQALVIVNANHASASDVVQLAAKVRDHVWQRYQIHLEHEVRFMANQQETYLDQLMERR
ncbi:UDP-N-acetylmuramate dehydrogenase [Vibrio xiamenensis]|uniref:UDP-N-acetylenolpyruvoylglucosamine reductase n=1 Tax=Vibrio xiamenensis TaxID=861298 RepID=A0A1G8EXA4_9VIBR|nr:UDP-N-acetylmuramate dehydrogenase [Vibrio xiamenensis]SDH74447.1 UDP-N-acetylmuramate dehydrogenase [Vibrio xiamenensis]